MLDTPNRPVETAPFVGRERELSELTTLVGAATQSRGSFVVLTGAAGIGKTRIADEVVGRTGGKLRLVSVTCGPRDGTPPFWPWTQVVRDLIGHDGERWPGLATLAGGDDPLASPAPNERGPARARLFEDIVSLLAVRATEKRPLLVLMDDLHDADASSLLMVAHVARRIASLPVAILATWRTGDLHPPVGVGADVLRPARVIPVAPLGVAQITSLAEAVTGASLSDEQAGLLHRRTSGNPLLANELLTLVTLDDGGADWGTIETLVPDSARRTVTDRLAMLAAEDRRFVATASVFGTVFPLDALAGCAGASTATVLDSLSRAHEIGLLGALGPHSGAFSHDLIRDAVYDALSPAERARLHRCAGDALVDLSHRGRAVEPIEPARQFLAAGPDASGLAATYARAAADRAMSLLAYEQAAALYERALAVAGDAVHHVELLLCLGDARTASGDRAGAREAYLDAAASARRIARPDLLATAALGLGGSHGFEVAMLDRQQIDLLDEAMRSLPDDDLAWRASVTARLSVAASFVESADHRLEMSTLALELARQSDDEPALAAALAAHSDAIAGPDHCEERAALATQILELAGRLRDRQLDLLGRRLLVVACLEQGDFAGADAAVQSFSVTAASLRQPLYEWYVPLWRAMSALMQGQIDECRAELADAERIGTDAGSENAWLLTSTLRWCLCAELGLTEEADGLLARLDPAEFTGVWPIVTRALGAAQSGRLDEARARLDVAAPRLAGVDKDSEWLPTLSQVTEVVGHIGGHPIASWTYDALLPYRSLYAVEGIGAAVRGPVERDLGVLAAALGERDAALGHFGAALDATRGAGGALLVARTLRDAGVALGDRGRLGEARAAYDALGLDRRVGEIDRMLGTPVPGHSTQPVLRRDGDVWHLAFGGRETTLRDSKGMRDLAALVAQPGQAVAALDLASEGGTAGAPATDGDLHEAGDVGEVLDAEARRAYKRRLVELEADIDDADRAADIGRSARATAERDALIAELSSAYGIGGRARRAGHPAERARSTVTARIRDTMKRIERAHPELGTHLRRSVRTGRLCVYEP